MLSIKVSCRLTTLRSNKGLGGVVGLTLPMSRADRGSRHIDQRFPNCGSRPKSVVKFSQVGRQGFSGNIYFLSFICKMNKKYCLPPTMFSEFSIDLQRSSKF